MSLQIAAKHLASHGRGPDTTLVHMTPGEVASLQSLAQQHGGSLTTNPHTGLPEAGFLSALLPMAAGAGLAAMGMPAGYAALAVGATSAATSGGDLKKGLMAGMSAYGGAGMAESFMGAGLGTMGGAMAAPAAEAAPAVAAAPAVSAAPAVAEIAPSAGSIAGSSMQEAVNQSGMYAPALTSAAPAEVAKQAAAMTPAAQAAQQSAALNDLTMGQRWDALKAGATGANAMKYVKDNPFTSLGVAASFMAPDENKAPQTTTDTDRGPRAGLQYHPGWSTPLPKPNMYGVEQTYNRPYYAAEGGLMSLARGGRAKDYDNVEMSRAMRELLAQQDRSLREIQRLKAQQAGTPPAQLDQKQLFADYLQRVAGGTGTGTGVEVAPKPGTGAEIETEKPALPFLESPVASNTMGNQGGGQTPEQRAEREAAWSRPQDYLSINRYDPEATARLTEIENAEPGDRYAPAQVMTKDIQSNASLAAMSPAERAMHMADVRAINPLRTLADDAFTKVGILPALSNMYTDFRYPGLGKPLAPGVPKAPVEDRFAIDPARQAAIVQRSNEAANKTYGNSVNSGPQNDGRADTSGNDGSRGIGGTSYGSVAPGYGGGSEAATGGLSTLHGFEHMAHGGASNPYDLGSYSDGSRLLKGPGDGVSDSIPATIGKGRPARLADGEFVVPARIVSEIGNGSTEAGARKLYAMMDRIQAGRKKSIGKDKVAVNSRADKHLPA